MAKRKICLIKQPLGLGDILYLQKLACHYFELGYKIIWPVTDSYLYLNDYLNIDKIYFCSQSDDFSYKEVFQSNEREIITSDFIFIQPLLFGMKQKYSAFSLSDSNWQNYIKINRNLERELICYKHYCDLHKDFIFVNNIFNTPPNVNCADLKLENTLYPIINIQYSYLNIFNIFDYLSILENAKEIHTIETSFCYLIEYLKTTNNLYLYPRKANDIYQYENFDYIHGIYKKNWVYMDF